MINNEVLAGHGTFSHSSNNRMAQGDTKENKKADYISSTELVK